jgi:hypothetical protein
VRWILLAAFLLLGCALLAGPARAHGDQFRDPRPGDLTDLPPGLRPPTATPPPLPPDPAAPVLLPADDWFFWWQLNATSYEHVKYALYWGRYSRPLFVSDDRPEHWYPYRWLREGVQEVAQPALLRVLDPKTKAPPHVVAAALLALGKLATEAPHARVLLDAAAASSTLEASVEEAALLALGLLRRRHPADQRAPEGLDDARALLLACLEDGTRRTRARTAAAIALGLLADQPTAGGDDARRRTVSCLLDALDADGEIDVACAVLWALGRQDSEHFDASARERLRILAGRRRTRPSSDETLPSAWALTTLGRVGTLDDLTTFRTALLDPARATAHQQRGAALGLGALGERLGGGERARVEPLIRAGLPRARDESQRGALLISWGRVLAAAVRAGEFSLVEASASAGPLLEALARDAGSSRGFAALALGHVARAIDEGTEDQALVPLRAEILEALGRISREESETRLRAAAVLGLGVARDVHSRKSLVSLLEDGAFDEDLRASAAWSLGLIGEPTAAVLRALGRAMRQKTPFELRRRAVRALALMGHPLLADVRKDAVQLLLEDLAAAESVVEQRDTLVLLARFGDHRALEALVAVLADKERSALVRALAASALGAVGDTENPTALDLLRCDVDPQGLPPAIRRILRYL